MSVHVLEEITKFLEKGILEECYTEKGEFISKMHIIRLLLLRSTDNTCGFCGDKMFQLTCLPNGLASAPRIFTKLLMTKSEIQWWLEKNTKTVIYPTANLTLPCSLIVKKKRDGEGMMALCPMVGNGLNRSKNSILIIWKY